jgi:general secretion pathway protein K
LNSLVKWEDPPIGMYKIDAAQVAVFRTLLERLDIDVRYADLLVDWIDSDTAPESQGGEDTLYLTQVPPYRPPNTFIWHASELLALPGFGPEQYAKIAPYVTALPVEEDVNVCTASGLVLDAIESLGQQSFANQDLKTLREKSCFPTKQAFLNPIGTRPSRTPCRPGPPKSPHGSGCAPTFALAPRSSFCTVFYSAKAPAKSGRFSAVLEANKR